MQLDEAERISQWQSLPGRMRARAANLKMTMTEHTGARPLGKRRRGHLGHFEQRLVAADRIACIHGSELVNWLRARPPASLEFEIRESLASS